MMDLRLLITCLAAIFLKISVIAHQNRDFLLHEKAILSILTNARPAMNLSKKIEKQPFFVSKKGCLWGFIDYFLRSCRIFA